MCVGGVPSHSLFNQADPRRPEATTCGRLRSRSRFQPGDATAGCGADAGGPERKPGSPGTPARWRGEACSVHTHEAARRFQPRLPGHSAHTPPAPRARRRPHGRGHTCPRPRRPAPDHLMSRVPWRPPSPTSPPVPPAEWRPRPAPAPTPRGVVTPKGADSTEASAAPAEVDTPGSRQPRALRPPADSAGRLLPAARAAPSLGLCPRKLGGCGRPR